MLYGGIIYMRKRKICGQTTATRHATSKWITRRNHTDARHTPTILPIYLMTSHSSVKWPPGLSTKCFQQISWRKMTRVLLPLLVLNHNIHHHYSIGVIYSFFFLPFPHFRIKIKCITHISKCNHYINTYFYILSVVTAEILFFGHLLLDAFIIWTKWSFYEIKEINILARLACIFFTLLIWTILTYAFRRNIPVKWFKIFDL